MKAAVVEEIAKPLVVHAHCRTAVPMTPSSKSRPIVSVSPTITLGREAGPGSESPRSRRSSWAMNCVALPKRLESMLRNSKKGDRVAIPFNHSCGRCEQCQAGHQNVCLDLRMPMLHYTGGFGRYTQE